MLAEIPFGPELAHWQVWVAPVVGVMATGLTLIMGRAVLRRRRLAPPPPKPDQTPRDPFLYGSATERRTSLRRRGKQIKVFISDAEAKAEPVEGWVVDRSMSGLCLAVSQAVADESVLSLRTADAPIDTPWVQVQVRRTEQLDGHWELGCQFVRTPTWSVLLLFG
jgi:hypothetical protein